MDDAAVTPPDHFRQDGRTESYVCVSYELQWCQYVDCRGLNRVTTHIFSVIFENSLEIRGKQLKWLLWRDFLPLASWSDMDDAAVTPSDHFRQDGLTASCV